MRKNLPESPKQAKIRELRDMMKDISLDYKGPWIEDIADFVDDIEGTDIEDDLIPDF